VWFRSLRLGWARRETCRSSSPPRLGRLLGGGIAFSFVPTFPLLSFLSIPLPSFLPFPFQPPEQFAQLAGQPSYIPPPPTKKKRKNPAYIQSFLLPPYPLIPLPPNTLTPQYPFTQLSGCPSFILYHTTQSHPLNHVFKTSNTAIIMYKNKNTLFPQSKVKAV